MKRHQLIAIAAIVLVACVDGGRSSGPNFAISDATHGAAVRNGFFFWLPPIVPAPSPTGDFNRFAAPVVTVCELVTSGAECAKSGSDPILVAQFSVTSGTDGQLISITGQEYHVNWHTDISHLNPDKVYRIAVAVEGRDYGFADVEVGLNAKELKNVDRNEFVPLVDGRTLPIRFRIEAGASCAGREGSCAEAIVDPNVEEKVILENDDNVRLAFGDFPVGWTNGPQVVRIERIPDGGFRPGQGPLGTRFPQYPLFFHYFTSAPEPFNLPVRIGVCNVQDDPEGDAFHPPHRGSTVLAMGGEGDFRTLPFAPVIDVLGTTCFGAEVEGSDISALPPGLGDVAARVGLFAASLLAPRRLEASALVVDGGMGGSTEFFSPAGTVDTGGLADLTVHDVSVTPPNPVSGQTVTISAIVSNSGGAAAGPATVNLCDIVFLSNGSGGTCAQPQSPTLAPGASSPVSGQVTTLGAGTHTLVASVDTFDVVPESDETNNRTVGPEFTVSGPPTIDGNFAPGEWAPASQTPFTVNVPGGTVAGTLYVMNDAQNLYLAVRFPRTVVDGTNLLNFEFDNNNNGVGPEDGDDYFTFTPATGFSDAFRSGCPSGGGSCVTTDQTNGVGAFFNNGSFTVYELSHPLNSGETGKDFALTAPTTVGMLLQLSVGTGHTVFPAGTFPTYITISITAPSIP